VFNHNHSKYSPPPSCTFHILLCKFTTLYTFRHIHNFSTPAPKALINLRHENRRRAVRWREGLGYGSFHHVLLEEAARETTELDAEGEGPLAGLPSLLDLLPDFIALTAARTVAGAGSPGAHAIKTPIKLPANNGAKPESDDTYRTQNEWTTTRQWLELAAEMMLQACLEQFLELNNHAFSTILESFAWGSGPWVKHDGDISTTNNRDHRDKTHLGVDPQVSDADPNNRATRPEDYEATSLNSTFNLADEDTGSSDDEISDNENTARFPDGFHPKPESSPGAKTWRAIRHAYLQEISIPLRSHRKGEMLPFLKALQSRHPRSAFDKHMQLFLSSLLGSHPPPVLVQLARGDDVVVDGVKLSAEESEGLRSLAGLS